MSRVNILLIIKESEAIQQPIQEILTDIKFRLIFLLPAPFSVCYDGRNFIYRYKG